ncbi:MAG: DUF4280 domain-containing protein [Planctomycetes bacterium]|nr:DUF4280 domain-containing protein [Planctomycetota bacterium]
MPKQVVMGAQLMCSFGVAPSALIVPPASRTLVGGVPAANIMDFKPMANIPPFGMCTTLSNPTVASATSAAQGVLTPVPCVPVTVAPWAPPSPTALVGGMPALNSTAKCQCAWGGSISIVSPGQVQVDVP